MQHSHNVDIVKAVLGSQEMVVYGEDLLRHSVADGEAMHVTVAAIPIGRPESAAVLKVYFAQCGNVTWGKVLDAAHGLVDCLTSEFIATFKMLVRWHFSCKNRGIHVRRDDLVSVMYSAELNSATSSITRQRTDRHGILAEKSPDIPLFS